MVSATFSLAVMQRWVLFLPRTKNIMRQPAFGDAWTKGWLVFALTSQRHPSSCWFCRPRLNKLVHSCWCDVKRKHIGNTKQSSTPPIYPHTSSTEAAAVHDWRTVWKQGRTSNTEETGCSRRKPCVSMSSTITTQQRATKRLPAWVHTKQTSSDWKITNSKPIRIVKIQWWK